MAVGNEFVGKTLPLKLLPVASELLADSPTNGLTIGKPLLPPDKILPVIFAPGKVPDEFPGKTFPVLIEFVFDRVKLLVLILVSAEAPNIGLNTGGISDLLLLPNVKLNFGFSG